MNKVFDKALNKLQDITTVIELSARRSANMLRDYTDEVKFTSFDVLYDNHALYEAYRNQRQIQDDILLIRGLLHDMFDELERQQEALVESHQARLGSDLGSAITLGATLLAEQEPAEGE